jgi:hypothetical protein
MRILRDSKLAVAKGIPQFNGLIPTPTDYLSVIRAERHRQNIVGVTYETAGSFPGVKIPETESLVPRR